MEKKKIIILVFIIVLILVLLGIILYKYDNSSIGQSNKDQSSIESKEELNIESVDYSALIPVTGNIKKHYTGVTTSTKSDQVNYDLLDIYIMDNNEIIVTQSYGSNIVAYFGSYAGNFDNDNVKIVFQPVLKGASCNLTTYQHEIIDIYKNTDESIFFEELDANKEVVKLIDDGNKSNDLLKNIECYKDVNNVQ